MQARSYLVTAIGLILIGVALYLLVPVRGPEQAGPPQAPIVRSEIRIPASLAAPSGEAPKAADRDYLVPPEWRAGAREARAEARPRAGEAR